MSHLPHKRVVYALLTVLTLLLAACGGGGSAESESPAESAAETAEEEATTEGGESEEETAGEEETASETAAAGGDDLIEGRPEPADEAPDEEVRIAMIGFSNNPYWVVVESGATAANEVLSSRNGSVDWIVAGAQIDVPTVDAAIRAAVAQGYSAVGFFIAGEGNCALIEELAGQDVPTGAYNTLLPCVEESGGVINYAQAQVEAGQLAAEQMIELSGGGPGTVGIVTSQFTAPGAEQRRMGFIEGLEGSELTPVNEGVEARDSASDTFTATQNFIQSSEDLVGIYATAGGPFGAAQAVAAAGRQDDLTVIGFDITPENIAVLEDGSMDGVIGQDAFGQGYNVAIELYNAVVTGETPEEVLVPAESPFVTPDDLAELEQLEPGAVGAS